MKKVLFIFRQLLILILTLQLLNLSICSESYWEYYNYSSNGNGYDPTETVVEWVVELKKGNQAEFSYNNNINLKGLCKSFSWHIDIHHQFPVLPPTYDKALHLPPTSTCDKPAGACIEILSPPPEHDLLA